MLSPTYEITTAQSHTDELISPPYDIAIVTISYGRVTMSSVWDSMMSKKIWGGPSTPPYIRTYTAAKKFMNTSTTAVSVASFILQGRYLENQTSKAVEILHDFISYNPLTDLHMVQNKASKLRLKSLRNTTAHISSRSQWRWTLNFHVNVKATFFFQIWLWVAWWIIMQHWHIKNKRIDDIICK